MNGLYASPDCTPWASNLWPNFTPAEIACPHCGEVCIDEDALNAIQAMRTALKAPLHINSAHRCVVHNRAIGGAARSEHLGLAFDIALAAHTPVVFHDAAIAAGFRGIGYGETYLHLDVRDAPVRWHYSKRAVELWAGWLCGYGQYAPPKLVA